MLTESEKRAAALAVSRYGVDRQRLGAAARSVLRAQAAGRPADLLSALVGERLLSPLQAEELRRTLGLPRTKRGGAGDARARPSKPEDSSILGGEALPGTGPELRRIGEYPILRRLGEGGMGAVYLAYDEAHARHVAIKVLPDDLAANPSYVDRFRREARSLIFLDHPNIVRGLAVGRDPAGARHYLVLEYVDGPSAHALLDRFGRLTVGDAVHIILDIARALEHAHSRNIIHRDIKPDNILLTQSGVAKLADLGLAKRTDEASNLTGARQAFGTPYYMPYEQAINARQADSRSDLYALGATFYHLLTGAVPFPGESALEVTEQKDRGLFVPASARNTAVPEALDRVLGRMLARSPRDRYQTASELIVDLERSGLNVPVPSFVDADRALQDPLVRARLTAPPPATRLDLGSSLRETPRPRPADVWYLRYRNREGRWCKARATTRQIRAQLRAGRLTSSLQAARQPQGEYRPLAVYAEFDPAAARNGTGPQARPTAARPALVRARRTWLLPLGLALLSATLGLASWLALR